MNAKIYSIVLCMVALNMTGCATIVSGAMNRTLSDADVTQKTEHYFGATHKEIVISNIDKGMISTTYQTKYKGTLYNCRIYYGDVECLRPGFER